MATILLTGVAGFIGSFVAKRLHEEGHTVIGIDNFTDYYDVKLKHDRITHVVPKECTIIQGDILDKELLNKLVKEHKVDTIVHLAAQAGVRHSLSHPDVYIQTNVQGTNNIFELARHNNIKRVVYASSSSVYGGNTKVPFSESDRVDTPISLYAATKKANELQAHTYSHLFNLTTIGLRFFTVYGPWGRPDMALFLFTKAITEGKPINVYNHGDMQRDFTYVDDIVSGVVSSVTAKLEGAHIFNLGNSNTVKLADFIALIEENLGKKAEKNMLPMQPGDVPKTSADIKKAKELLGFEPTTNVDVGIKKFIEWYIKYHA